METKLVRNLKEIDKTTFTYYMNKIIERYQLNEEIYDTMYNLTGGFEGQIGNALDLRPMIELLAAFVEDTNDTIGYFIYECDCGRDGANKIEVDGEYVPFETIDDLWEQLMREKETQ